MLNIDSAIQDQLAAEELISFVLLHLAIGGATFCYTDCDVPIYWHGNMYLPRGFRVPRVSYSAARIVDNASLEIDDVAQDLSPAFIGGNPQGSPVGVYNVVMDANYHLVGTYPDDHVVLFSGTIDDWQSPDEAKLEMTIVNDIVQWQQRTLRIQSSSCSWRVFKGQECQYAGAETACDRSYARCAALANTDNFGGERWLPSIEDANIWWGSAPK